VDGAAIVTEIEIATAIGTAETKITGDKVELGGTAQGTSKVSVFLLSLLATQSRSMDSLKWPLKALGFSAALSKILSRKEKMSSFRPT
jgi:hypothetical protein